MSRFVRSSSLLFVVGAATALLATTACDPGGTQTTPTPTPTTSPSPTVQPGGDEDRPPVVVSGGSVHLRMIARDRGKGKNQDHGEWLPDGSNWFQEHDHDKAERLFVNVIYGEGSEHCDNPDWNFSVDTMDIGYDVGGTLNTFQIYLEPLNAMGKARLFTNAKAKKDPKVKFWLELTDASAVLKSVKLGDATCKFADPKKGQVHVYPTTNKIPN